MRRRTRRRSARGPLRYAPIPLGPARRRSPWRRRGLGLLALLVALSAVVAVVAGATIRSAPHRAGAVRPAGSAAARPVAGRGAAVPHVVRAREQQQPQHAAVAKLLGTTPLVTGGRPRHRVVALTFDDGPGPDTPQIVGQLLRLHAPATFFVVGQQLQYFAAGLRDEIRHGFEIGDHTQNHSWLIRLSAATQYAQIQSVVNGVRRLGASAPDLFRPPYGAYDRATLAVLRKLHMLGVLWSVDPGDWRRPGVGAIVRSVVSAARPGSIIELHDGGGDRSQTAAALPEIVAGLRRQHLKPVTVSELLALDPPPAHQRLPHLSAA